MCAVLLCTGVQPSSAAYYDSGQDGTSWENAYIISSAEDLAALRDRVNSGEEPSGKYYVLASDIDLTAYTDWEGIGDEPYFKGHFDGQNHTIQMNSQTNSVFAGLFHTVDSGNENIAVRNLNLTGTIKADCAGTVVHYLYSGIVENCSFSGTITTSGRSYYGAGGIAAHLEGGTVRNCRVSANISGNEYAGGIAGEVLAGNIENCTVDDSTRITAEQIGGIVGYVNGSFSGRISGNRWPSIYPETGNDYTPQPQEDTSAEWNGHRYQVFNEALMWEQARSRCEALGGHLATITSQAEQGFIDSLLTGSISCWLGAYADDSGLWHWVTDEPFEKQYQNYTSGQPDGSGGYVMILESGRWDDVRSDENVLGFICEWDNKPEQVKAAPVAQSFSEWLANPELRADGDGAAPSPVDRSHLRNNPPRITASSVFAAADENLPVSYDARKAIGLPEVRDQGKYNTCWAFAAIGALEASYRQQDITALGEDPDLSELHLAYFTYRTIFSQDISAEYSILNQQGNPEKAAGFLSAQTAPVKEADMPYTAASDSDSEIEAFATGKTFTRAPVILRETKIFGQIGPENMFLIKKAIIGNGAVYFHYFHNDSGYNEADHSLYYTGLKGRHAALLVGWDDEFPAERFRNQPSANGAWFVRNSWGKDFGDDGYFWVSYEQAINAVMDECCVFIASEDVTDKTAEEKKNDNGGGTQSITPQWSGNIFRAERNENIVSISFQTTDNNAEYRIFINNLGKDKPSNPGSAIKPVLSGNMPYAGYHTMNLPNPVEVYSGDYYSVIVKMKTSYEYPTAAEGSIDGYFTASVTEGQSYFASGDEVPSVWVDGTDRNSLSGKEYNATVRVLTVARESAETAPVIVTESLPAGRAGEEYSATIEARGTGSIEWRAGRLPEGFAFSRKGVLSGKSSAAADEEVRFTAINNAGSDEAVLRLVVEAKKVVPDEPVVPVDPQSGDVFPDEPVLPDEPVVPESQDKRSVGSSSGGCSSGMWGVLILGAAVFAGRRR